MQRLRDYEQPFIDSLRLFQGFLERLRDYDQPFKEATVVERVLSRLLLKRTFGPESLPLAIWYRLQFGIAILHALVVPLQLAFAYDLPALWLFDLVVDCISIACVYFGFHVVFANEEGIMVTHPLITARNYAKTTFFVDLLGCCPFEYFYGNPPISSSTSHFDLHLLSFVRLTRLFQCLRIPYAFSHLENDIERPTGLVRAVKYVVYTVLFLNFLTCVTFLFACPPLELFEDAETLTHDMIYVTDSQYWCLIESWLINTPFARQQNVSGYEMYTASVYFVTLTTISVG